MATTYSGIVGITTIFTTTTVYGCYSACPTATIVEDSRETADGTTMETFEETPTNTITHTLTLTHTVTPNQKYLPATLEALDEQLVKIVPLFISIIVFMGIPLGILWLNMRFNPPAKSNSKQPESALKDTLRAPPLKAADHVNDGKHHLLLAATGSVATIKIPNIVDALSKYDDLSIRILLSENAVNFLQAQSHEQPSLQHIAKMKNVDGIYRDPDEWQKPWVRGDNILHIELRRWADLMVIAPLSANSLAKLAQGMSDNLISSVVRAWDATGILDPARPGVALPYGGKKGIMVAPAMNTAMWHHPATAEHMQRLSKDWSVEKGGWFEVLRPIEKELACGDTGSGAMHDWKLIVAAIESRLQLVKSEASTKR